MAGGPECTADTGRPLVTMGGAGGIAVPEPCDRLGGKVEARGPMWGFGGAGREGGGTPLEEITVRWRN